MHDLSKQIVAECWNLHRWQRIQSHLNEQSKISKDGVNFLMLIAESVV